MAGSLFSQIADRAIQEGTVDKVLLAAKPTEREQEAVRFLADGVSTADLSRHFNVAVLTLTNDIRISMDRLAPHRRLEMAASAGRRVLIEEASAPS